MGEQTRKEAAHGHLVDDPRADVERRDDCVEDGDEGERVEQRLADRAEDELGGGRVVGLGQRVGAGRQETEQRNLHEDEAHHRDEHRNRHRLGPEAGPGDVLLRAREHRFRPEEDVNGERESLDGV